MSNFHADIHIDNLHGITLKPSRAVPHALQIVIGKDEHGFGSVATLYLEDTKQMALAIKAGAEAFNEAFRAALLKADNAHLALFEQYGGAIPDDIEDQIKAAE